MILWVDATVALAIHNEQLNEHGGAPGLRDQDALESALSRPQNRYAYQNSDIFDLAAAYAFGLARNHPFVDGNKRTSAVVTELFLGLNGFKLNASDASVVLMWLSIADGSRTDHEIGKWLRENCSPRPA